MEIETCHYIKILRTELAQRQRRSPHYSLRAFARDLGMHSATLSMVLSNKRTLPKKNLDSVIGHLKLSPQEEALFRESFLQNKIKLHQVTIDQDYLQKFVLDESCYQIIAEWEHYAVISLLETKEFISSIDYIARALNITSNRARVVVDNLLTADLLQINEDGEFVGTKPALKTTEDVKSRALNQSHKETLEMGKSKLDEIALEFRDFSSMTMAVNPQKILEAKALIREFRNKLATLLREGDKSEVYQFAFQFYPLTNLEKQKIKIEIKIKEN